MLLVEPFGGCEILDLVQLVFSRGKGQGGFKDLGSLLVSKRNVEVQHGVSMVYGEHLTICFLKTCSQALETNDENFQRFAKHRLLPRTPPRSLE